MATEASSMADHADPARPQPAGPDHAAVGRPRAEHAAMLRALELARLGLGTTSPNPIVGAVVLDSTGAPVGEGWHVRAGGPHAEVVALTAAGPRAAGGTVVLTLEPCDHTGRTGPCTQALIQAGIHRVCYAVADPLHGGGHATLRAAGLVVAVGLFAEEAARDNEAWLHAVRTGRPFLTWKYAATLDGRSAAADGSSRWITGEAARANVHRVRAESDAVLVGIGTVLADDPQLTVREPTGSRQPLRVVLDPAGRTPRAAKVRDEAAETLFLTAADVRRDTLGRLDLGEVLALLHERGTRSLLLEGGPTLAGAFLRAGLVDKVLGYLAPALLGAGSAALGDAGAGTIRDAFRLRITEVQPFPPDLRITAYPWGAA